MSITGAKITISAEDGEVRLELKWSAWADLANCVHDLEQNHLPSKRVRQGTVEVQLTEEANGKNNL